MIEHIAARSCVRCQRSPICCARSGPRWSRTCRSSTLLSRCWRAWRASTSPRSRPQLGLGELHISRCEASVCLPLSAAPLHVCLGSAGSTRPATPNGLSRCCGPWRSRSSIFQLAWRACARALRAGAQRALERGRANAHGGRAGSPGAKPVAGRARREHRAEQRARTQAAGRCGDGARRINPRRLQSVAFDYGARVALCVTADLWSGLSAYFGCADAGECVDAREKLELCRS